MFISRLLLVSLVLALALPCSAKTWFVGGPDGDFTEIQPAIDAAQDGDVILVRPGTYQPFTLTKGVMVRSSEARFDITSATVRVESVPDRARAGIAGIALHAAPYGGRLLVQGCAGEVVVEDLLLDSTIGAEGGIEIESCDKVSLTSLDCTGGALEIVQSYVRISDARIQ